jgi:hypothetical protein
VCSSLSSHPEEGEQDVDKGSRHYKDYCSGYLHHRFPEPRAHTYVRRAGLDLWKRDSHLFSLTLSRGSCIRSHGLLMAGSSFVPLPGRNVGAK